MPKFTEALYQFSKQLNQETHLEPLAMMVLEQGGKLCHASQGFLVLFNPSGLPTETIFWELPSLSDADKEAWDMWLYSGMVGLVYHTQRVVILSNITVDPRWGTLRIKDVLPEKGSALGLPLLYNQKMIGVLVFLNPQTGHFESDIIPFADEIGELCAGHIHKADLLRWTTSQDVRDQLAQFQLQRDLSAMIYHDLRVPLQTLRASSGKLGELLANHDDISILNLLQVNIRSVRQLRRLVDNLLDLERLETGKSFIQKSDVNLHDIMSDAVELVQPLAVEANQHFRFIVANDLPTLTVDADMILRVIVNLIENALKYTPQGGQISIGAKIKDGMVLVNVQDSGAGIPKELQEVIFEKFSRAHQETTTHKSIGLGLTFCRLAIDAHGGKIWVESEAGKGANFIFTLPLPAIDADSDTQSELASTA
ncbi:MAG: ATP-binding protein [bacterium]|nr:ATP-binding protein [bacterium]